MSKLMIIKTFAFEVFGQNSCRVALATYREGKSFRNLNFKTKLAYFSLRLMNAFIPMAKMVREHEKASIEQPQIYNKHLLNLMTNNIFDLPEVIVDKNAPTRINVLVPAFTINTISAGFFGVFNVALFIAKQGYQVRLVLFDNFYYVEDEFRSALSKFPSMENLFETLEIEYIGLRKKPLTVSANDNCVATVWYSAYFADKIAKKTQNKPFIYLIQDFEAAFYPFNSQYCLARNSYNLNYHTLASSSALLDYLNKNNIIKTNEIIKSISFNNAYSSSIYNKDDFATKKSSNIKRFVFYSRPAVNRNMFEMAALALINAYENGAFKDSQWEFYGMGIGNTTVQLADGVEVKQLPRMPLSEYEEITKTFDLCLTLMSSPHPSLIPMDLAASGAIVVTNTFETKTPEYLKNISENIIPANPTLLDLTSAITMGVKKVNDITFRYKNSKINWPKSWDDTWSDEHRTFLKDVLNKTQ